MLDLWHDWLCAIHKLFVNDHLQHDLGLIVIVYFNTYCKNVLKLLSEL